MSCVSQSAIQAEPYIFLIVLMLIKGVFGQSWSVSYEPASVCALEGSSVKMSCSYTHPSNIKVQVNWAKSSSGEAYDVIQYTDGFHVQCQDQFGMCSLYIPSVTYSDSGNFYCKITTNDQEKHLMGHPKINLIISELKVLPPRRVKEGSHVTLTCSTTCDLTSSPSFIWSKDGRPVEDKQIINNQLQLNSFSDKDEGNYTCAVRGYEEVASPPYKILIMYPPENIYIEIDPSSEINKGSVLTLTCMSDAKPPVEKYTWFKWNGSTPVGSGQQYSITNIRSEDGGQYYCEARNKYGAENSTTVSITITDQSPVIVAVSVSFCLVLGLVCAAVWIRCQQRRRSLTTTKPIAVYQSQNPTTTKPNAVYQRQNPTTIKPNEVYWSLDPNIIQPDAVYHSLNPNAPDVMQFTTA